MPEASALFSRNYHLATSTDAQDEQDFNPEFLSSSGLVGRELGLPPLAAHGAQKYIYTP